MSKLFYIPMIITLIIMIIFSWQCESHLIPRIGPIHTPKKLSYIFFCHRKTNLIQLVSWLISLPFRSLCYYWLIVFVDYYIHTFGWKFDRYVDWLVDKCLVGWSCFYSLVGYYIGWVLSSWLIYLDIDLWIYYQLFIRWLIYWKIYSSFDLFINRCLIRCSLIDWFIVQSIDWLIDWF